MAPNNTPADFTEDELPILLENEVVSPTKKVSETYILKKRGNICKMRGNKAFHEDKQKNNEYMNMAESFYNQALSSAKKLLGDHELTYALDKRLEDLCFNLHKNGDTLTNYANFINLHKNLKFILTRSL